MLVKWLDGLCRLPLLPRRLKISYILFFSHLLLVIWLIVVMSYNRYRSEWQTRVDHAVEVAHISMNPIVADLSLYASGLNYANINLPVTRNLFRATDKLLYFQVDAISDFSQKPFRFAYSRQNDEVWRTGLGPNDVKAASDEVNKLEEYQRQHPGVDKVKYAFLLSRAREHYANIVADRKKEKRFRWLYRKPALSPGEHLIDEKTSTLHILLTLHNKKGGKVWAVFNATDLLNLRTTTIDHILREALIAFLVSSVLIIWATWWIVQPLRRLSRYMEHEIHELDVAALPELNRDDEIGQLARRFKNLINRIRSQISELERLAIIDSLTGLGSRRLYDTSGPALLKQARRSKQCFGMLVLDVDNFKLYNDTYGHAHGDEGLRMIGKAISTTLHRETDMAFRIGGEEFVALIQVTHAEEVRRIAEDLRKTILGQKIEHKKNGSLGVISVSIGGVVLGPSHTRPYPSFENLFKQADKALYQAKAQGRNRVILAGQPYQSETTTKAASPSGCQ